MGDLVGQAVEGTLYFLPFSEFQRVRSLNVDRAQRAAIFADMCRLNALYMIARAGSGHIGSSFSSLDIVSWLHIEEMADTDVYFSSKGHDAPGYYAALIGLGRLDFELVHKLRKIDGLPGHPDIGTPGIVANTGSLGMGISKAKGMILANRLSKKSGRVFVMTGDGELQEGQFWESLLSAANFGLHELIVIIDHNKLQSDTFVKNVSDLGDLEAKLKAFGWRVERCDGNDTGAFAAILERLEGDSRPKVIIADTVKGKGVSFMEHTSLDSDVAMYRFHSGAPDAASYRRAAQEIVDRLQHRLAGLGESPLEFEKIEREPSASPFADAQRLVNAYSRALVELAQRHPNLVALDADLVLDTGLIPFREKYPERFIECGIAEQDMVSMAGGMALKGLLPVVHSFACFLSARPNEQIYNNATEKTKVIYVGSLAGVVPGGPGHSHQAVRDIASLSGIPNLNILEPANEEEVFSILKWCVEEATGPCYIRLVSLPWECANLADSFSGKIGVGCRIKEGSKVAIMAAGPVTVNVGLKAADLLGKELKQDVRVINMPWLNTVDSEWLSRELSDIAHLVVLDNHYKNSGLGQMVASNISALVSGNTRFISVGVDDIPPSGQTNEVLEHVGLAAQKVYDFVLNSLVQTSGDGAF